jgi:anti-sigma regulatory factor (Ser/Thr protein kinase)
MIQENSELSIHHSGHMSIIRVPSEFKFLDYGTINFDRVLRIFDWSLKNTEVTIDFSNTRRLNYQALSLFIPYIWHIRTQNCYIEVKHSSYSEPMWRLMGAPGWSQVLTRPEQNFVGNAYKPLIAIRNNHDFKVALEKTEAYTKNFNLEYEKTLRYVLSELLYNTIEHGFSGSRSLSGSAVTIPSIIQFNWYQGKDELSFIVADLGVGIKCHLEKAYPGFATDSEAIRRAIEPQVSGTFGRASSVYESKNNAGIGLYISSNIMRRLKADLYIVSGNGLLHVSPRDTTSKELKHSWPGTFVYGTVKLGAENHFELYSMMQELREKARQEIDSKSKAEQEGNFYVHVRNFFGVYAEDKEAAKRFRDSKIIQRIEQGDQITLDFSEVKAAPHSFLNALLATPISKLGMTAYKRIKVINALPEIRETIDFILDDNT